jgi:methyl-accepting chemotaxis protein
MRWTSEMSINRRLLFIAVTTIVVAQLIAGTILTIYDNQAYTIQKTREVTVDAQILAASLVSSIVFDDAKATQEYLNPLKANPEIEAAGAYGANRELIARYTRDGSNSVALPTAAPLPGTHFDGDLLLATVPVMQDKAVVGTVYLVANPEPLARRLFRYSSIVLLAIVGSLVVAIPISLPLNAAISRPIQEIASAASRIIAGDLTVELSAATRTDEIGVLVANFGEMVASLRQMTQALASGAKHLSETASSLLGTTSQVSASAVETATAVSQTSVTVEEVKQTVYLSSEKAQLVSEGAQRTSEVAESGQEAVEEVAQGMTHIREQVEAVALSILRLSEQGQAIGEIIAAVNDLADQSNLLAVNAAIEAARAGEQGRGFAVVAQEMKSLAEQSKQATAQVRAILGDVQKATEAAVLATERSTKAVDAGIERSAQAGDAIRMLTENIASSAQAAMQIAASTQQQLTGVSQVAVAMESIKDASVQNAEGVKLTEAAAKDLNELSVQLEALVRKYQS